MARDTGPAGDPQPPRYKGHPLPLPRRQGAWEESPILLYERNPAGRGLDFDDNPEDKSDFTRYAIEFRCLNPLTNTKKSPLPPLEELAEAVSTLTAVAIIYICGRRFGSNCGHRVPIVGIGFVV